MNSREVFQMSLINTKGQSIHFSLFKLYFINFNFCFTTLVDVINAAMYTPEDNDEEFHLTVYVPDGNLHLSTHLLHGLTDNQKSCCIVEKLYMKYHL